MCLGQEQRRDGDLALPSSGVGESGSAKKAKVSGSTTSDEQPESNLVKEGEEVRSESTGQKETEGTQGSEGSEVRGEGPVVPREQDVRWSPIQ